MMVDMEEQIRQSVRFPRDISAAQIRGPRQLHRPDWVREICINPFATES